MDALDSHRNDGYCTIQHQQSDTKSNSQTDLTSNPLGNNQLYQSESSQDNLQYASRVEDRIANDCEDALDHNQHQQQEHEQQQHDSQEGNFMAANEGDRVGHCQRACLFEGDVGLSQDDAFVPFCAEAISTTDPNQRYYTNKLYRPLKNGTNQVQQNHIYNQSNHRQHLESEFHLEEQDDALSMYAALEFMESTSQRAAFNKILEDDDGDDETNLGKDNDDSLDNLHLTSLIDSFVEFAASPLGNNQNSDDLGLYPQLSSITTELPDSGRRTCAAEKSSPSSEHQMNELNLTSADNYYQHSTTDLFRQQNLFGDQNYAEQSGSCYLIGTDNINSTSQEKHDQLSGDVSVSSQNYTDQHDRSPSCIKHDNRHISLSSEPEQNPMINNEIELVNTTTIAVNNSEKKKRSCEEETTTLRRQKLKKRRSIMSYSERNKQQAQASPSNDTNTEDDGSSNSRLDQIKELNDRLMNDEDDLSAISDNNSLRSEGSRRNPVVNHYRRRTANARERIRMREINQAFEKLKKVVPIELVEQAALESGEMSDQASARGCRRKLSPSSSNQGDPVKLTKITTLRMAVSYIAKLTEILNQTPGPTPNTSDISDSVSKVNLDSNQQAGETSGKSRPSRSKSRRSTQDSVKRRQKGKIDLDNKTTEKGISDTTVGHEVDKAAGQDNCQRPMIVQSNSTQYNQAGDQRNPLSHQQTAFISMPNQQKRQYIAGYPNQPLLISQPIGNERLVTPVALAFVGIPTNNNTNTQSVSNSSELIGPRNIQLVGIQKAATQNIIDPDRQHRTYNLQVAQPRQQRITTQSNQPQQVTLTLDDMNGLSVLRLGDTQSQSQPMPIQFRTISSATNQHQILQPNCQQPQIITTNDGVNYALRPILSQLTTNSLSESSMQTNYQQSTQFRICNNNNNNQPDNLITQSSNNIINLNSNNNLIRPNFVQQAAEEASLSQQAICNFSQQVGSFRPAQINAATTLTTGMSSDPVVNNCQITSNAFISRQKQFQDHTNQVQTTQSSNCITPKTATMFVPTSNLMTLSTGNQIIHTRQISLQGQNAFGARELQFVPQSKLVYINAIPHSGAGHQPMLQPRQQQVCILTDQMQNSTHGQLRQVVSEQDCGQRQPLQQQQQHQQMEEQQTSSRSSADQEDNSAKIAVRQDRLGFMTHFSAQSGPRQVITANETNITKLVANLATSIQPQNNHTRVQSSKPDPNTSEDVRQKQAQQQQHSQPQQPIRTYRFHNYDGNMINSHLYGNNSLQAQQQAANKRVQSGGKQQQDQNNKICDLHQPSTKHRSRQNSLSSICSTVSCSSSSLNYISSTSGSPSNSCAPVVSIMVDSSPGGCSSSSSSSGGGSNRSMTNCSPAMMNEDSLIDSAGIARSARVAT